MAAVLESHKENDAFSGLLTDVAVTTRQARKFYGLSKKEVIQAGGYAVAVRIRPATHSYGRLQRHEFLTMDKKVAGFEGHRLRHLAGTAAIRHLLNAPVAEWFSEADAVASTYVPDAVWHGPQGVVAIEYDSSGYKAEVVLGKGAAFFKEFEGGQVWGAAVPGRLPTLEKYLGEVSSNHRIMYAPWHE